MRADTLTSDTHRLQTFPDGLRVDGGRTEMQRMSGNAVPSLIAEVLAREIRRAHPCTGKGRQAVQRAAL
jgi:site-specific DNA-cytosine methylase